MRVFGSKVLGCIAALSFGMSSSMAFAAGKDTLVDSEDPAFKDDQESLESYDPWEDVNRPVFQFNLGFDRYVAKPFISAYDVIPADGRRAVSNVLGNLGEPLNAIHGVLQLNPKVAFTSIWRFILNTTFGFVGIRDFAREDAKLYHTDENLGRTLGHWGVPAGPYVVLPILGPSSVRDTTGKVGDWFADPVGWEETTWASAGQAIADGIDTRDSNAGLIEHLYYESLDPYVATRSSFRQHEAFKARNKE